MSVYRSGDGDSVPPTTTSSTYLGCFTDQHPKRGGTRIFSHGALISEDEMTSSVSKLERFHVRRVSVEIAAERGLGAAGGQAAISGMTGSPP